MKPLPQALIVVHSFGCYTRGDLIVDITKITAILEGGNNTFVMAVALPKNLEAIH